MEELIKSLPKVLRAVGDSSELNEAAAIAAWNHTAGEGLRAHAVPMKLDSRRLVVAVRDAIWQKQLALMKHQLLFRINTVLGQALLSDIELRIDPKSVLIAPNKTRAPTEIVDNEVPIDLWSAASSIKDKDLRQKFLRAALGMLKRKEQDLQS